MSQWHRVGRCSDFHPGVIRAVSIKGAEIAVVQLDGVFFAFSNFCTHEAVAFTAGYGLVRGRAVLCMMHSSWFDIETGEVLSGPAADDLTVYAVRIEGEEVLVQAD
jgi:3-phenylpropionate/trans-cinnamate dioxygenase ferredoxin subunit